MNFFWCVAAIVVIFRQLFGLIVKHLVRVRFGDIISRPAPGHGHGITLIVLGAILMRRLWSDRRQRAAPAKKRTPQRPFLSNPVP